jgi:hypothetical protein
MKWNKLYKYPKSIRSTIKGERHYELGQEKLPSVTTILSATESDEKKQAIQRWKAKVGEKKGGSSQKIRQLHVVLQCIVIWSIT